MDPDFPGTDGMEFIWLCRDTNDYDFVVSNLTSEPVLAPTVPPAQNTNQINEVGKYEKFRHKKKGSYGITVDVLKQMKVVLHDHAI